MLSFGGLLSEVIQGGAAGLNASNPGIVKVLGGFVFPVGLVMYVTLVASDLIFYSLRLQDRAAGPGVVNEQHDGEHASINAPGRFLRVSCRLFPWP